MKLVVGLGNPGRRYANMRHNVGFMVMDRLVRTWKRDPRLHAALAKKDDILYLKPQTYMNLSGTAVAAVRRYFNISVSQIIVVYDDKDLPFGTVRFREHGSSGGHRGMDSIVRALRTKEISRLKVGIAPAQPEHKLNTTAFVLEAFTKMERTLLPSIIAETIDRLNVWIKKTPTDPNV